MPFLPSLSISHTLLLTSFLLPSSVLLVKTYFRNHPLPASLTSKIQISESIFSPSSSFPFHSIDIVNPRHHITITDTRTIHLSRTEVSNISDEEILARFTKGFFSGWIFTPERHLLAGLSMFGMKLVPVGFSAIKSHNTTISSLSQLSGTTLPTKHSMLFGGNFMVLDINLKPRASPVDYLASAAPNVVSYIEIGFGDDRKSFAGFHRFEVTHNTKMAADKGGDAGVVTSYSTSCCNLSRNQAPFPQFVFTFHKLYALGLFRDGITEVLRAPTTG
ncbi:hypothetical protein AOQ84DRAFT_359619 [Glonium stellatum]|uniref:Uncharacterized protein n=1 Tax=Glonium stellatum TaxID=574774 RepID=A0A8E2FAG1_9PEZI|nr:hypothetical protein AOQ84DRAFT_359619 [Glonium stellatum]